MAAIVEDNETFLIKGNSVVTTYAESSSGKELEIAITNSGPVDATNPTNISLLFEPAQYWETEISNEPWNGPEAAIPLTGEHAYISFYMSLEGDTLARRYAIFAGLPETHESIPDSTVTITLNGKSFPKLYIKKYKYNATEYNWYFTHDPEAAPPENHWEIVEAYIGEPYSIESGRIVFQIMGMPEEGIVDISLGNPNSIINIISCTVNGENVVFSHVSNDGSTANYRIDKNIEGMLEVTVVADNIYDGMIIDFQSNIYTPDDGHGQEQQYYADGSRPRRPWMDAVDVQGPLWVFHDFVLNRVFDVNGNFTTDVIIKYQDPTISGVFSGGAFYSIVNEHLLLGAASPSPNGAMYFLMVRGFQTKYPGDMFSTEYWDTHDKFCSSELWYNHENGEMWDMNPPGYCSIIPPETEITQTVYLNSSIFNINRRGDSNGNSGMQKMVIQVMIPVVTYLPDGDNIWVTGAGPNNNWDAIYDYNYTLSLFLDRALTIPAERNGDGGWGFPENIDRVYLVFEIDASWEMVFMASVVDDEGLQQLNGGGQDREPLEFGNITAGNIYQFELTTNSAYNPYRDGAYAKSFILDWDPAFNGDVAEVSLESPDQDTYIQLLDVNGNIVAQTNDGGWGTDAFMRFDPANFEAPLTIIATTNGTTGNDIGRFKIVVMSPNASAQTGTWVPRETIAANIDLISVFRSGEYFDQASMDDFPGDGAGLKYVEYPTKILVNGDPVTIIKVKTSDQNEYALYPYERGQSGGWGHFADFDGVYYAVEFCIYGLKADAFTRNDNDSAQPTQADLDSVLESLRQPWVDDTESQLTGHAVWVPWLYFQSPINRYGSETIATHYFEFPSDPTISWELCKFNGVYYSLIDRSRYTVQGDPELDGYPDIAVLVKLGIHRSIENLNNQNGGISDNLYAYPMYCYGATVTDSTGRTRVGDCSDRCPLVRTDNINTVSLNGPRFNLSMGSPGGDEVTIVTRVLVTTTIEPNEQGFPQNSIWLTDKSGDGWSLLDYSIQAYYDADLTTALTENGEGGWYCADAPEFYLVITVYASSWENAFLARILDDATAQEFLNPSPVPEPGVPFQETFDIAMSTLSLWPSMYFNSPLDTQWPEHEAIFNISFTYDGVNVAENSKIYLELSGYRFDPTIIGLENGDYEVLPNWDSLGRTKYDYATNQYILDETYGDIPDGYQQLRLRLTSNSSAAMKLSLSVWRRNQSETTNELGSIGFTFGFYA
ncbi:hypothetical protein UFOVP116_404 [uncultured Caudovirales phage]|uniref:Uncharacterized protein n=1 Tax=uncultured Caudovirales phage TaxID=2100421 RepID=A0A6J5L7E6_9CAUD|nr:hypothetical protein UFOVP116_404 [uncultured Caudovirales phage]